MSIKLSVFDFFSHTIPGLLFLSIFTYFDYSFLGYKYFPIFINLELNLFSFTLLLITAYIVGLIMDKIAYLIWWKRFSKPLKRKTLEYLKNKYSEHKINIDLKYYHIYRTHIAKEDKEFFDALERFYAISHLLANISFALIVIALIEIILSIKDFFSIKHFIFALLIICFSFVSLAEAKKYHSWVITGVFNYMIDSNLKYENIVSKRSNQ